MEIYALIMWICGGLIVLLLVVLGIWGKKLGFDDGPCDYSKSKGKSISECMNSNMNPYD